jgi:site-specific recombinase XerC
VPLIGRPKVPKTLPKSYAPQAVTELVAAAIDTGHESTRPSDWPERDRAIVFTSLLAGLRADGVLTANVGDIRRTDDGGIVHVRGKGNKDRRIPMYRTYRRHRRLSPHTRHPLSAAPTARIE